MNDDIMRAAWISPNAQSQGKLSRQVQAILASFLDSNKIKLQIEFHTPQTLDLQKHLNEAKQEIEAIRTHLLKIISDPWIKSQTEFYCREVLEESKKRVP